MVFWKTGWYLQIMEEVQSQVKDMIRELGMGGAIYRRAVENCNPCDSGRGWLRKENREVVVGCNVGKVLV